MLICGDSTLVVHPVLPEGQFLIDKELNRTRSKLDVEAVA